MTKILNLTVIMIFSGLASCVSVHKSNMGQSVGDNKDEKLIASVEKNKRLSTNNITVLEFSVENKSDDFKKFDDVQMVLPKEVKDSVKLVVGSDLVSWSEGIQNKIERESHNFRMFMAGLVAVAGATSQISSNKNISKTAAGIAVAGAGTVAVDDFIRARNEIKNTQRTNGSGLIPEKHILYTPLSVPPGLFLKRYVVLHQKSGTQHMFRTLNLQFFKKGEKKEYALRFVAKNPNSEMVSSTCGEGDPTLDHPLHFRGHEILCEAHCMQVHKLNRNSCIRNIRSRLRRQR